MLLPLSAPRGTEMNDGVSSLTLYCGRTVDHSCRRQSQLLKTDTVRNLILRMDKITNELEK